MTEFATKHLMARKRVIKSKEVNNRVLIQYNFILNSNKSFNSKLTSANLKADRRARAVSRTLTKPDLELTNADVNIVKT